MPPYNVELYDADDGTDDNDQPHVCILFALPEETGAFYRLWQGGYTGEKKRQLAAGEVVVSSFMMDEDIAENDVPFVMACSGAGERNSARQLEEVLNSDLYITQVLICGFAGGLTAELKAGVLVIGDSVTNSSGDILNADSRLLATTESVRMTGVDDRRGLIYTHNKVLTQSVEKQELARRTGAIAVDMETYAAAQTAQTRNIPWMAVRVITDGVGEDMPLDFNAFADVDGNVDKRRIIAATLTHPWKIPGLIRLGSRAAKAADNLAGFLAAYVWENWTNPVPDTTP